MVAFAGAKYAARSVPIMVADNDHVVTSFTLVNRCLDFSYFLMEISTSIVCINVYFV